MKRTPRSSTPSPARRTLTTLTATVALTLTATLTATAAPAAPAQRPDFAVIEEAEDWATRDRRTGFDDRTATDARLDIQRLDPGDYGRGAALVALGASGSVRGRELLVAETGVENPVPDRVAAVYALGELGADRLKSASERLERLVRDPSQEVARAAMVALVRSGVAGGRRQVDVIGRGDSDLAEEAKAIVAHHVRRGAEPPESFRRLYALRWDAARNYGTIDGKLWAVSLLTELANDEAFLSALVLRLAAELDVTGGKDHLLEILFNGTGMLRIDAAVTAMPRELEQLIASGIWRPADRAEWLKLVQAIVQHELDPYFPRTLALTLEHDLPSIRAVAAGLLYQRDSRFEDILIDAFESDEGNARADAAYAVGAADLRDYRPRLHRMADDEDVWVAANALGALVRLGSPKGAAMAMDMLAGDPKDRRPRFAMSFFEVLARAAPDEDVMEFLGTISPTLDGPDRAMADSILLSHGARIPTDALRAELPLIDPRLPQAFRGAHALARSSFEKDVAMIGRLFPREAAPNMNLELAVGLVRAGDDAPLPLLRSAVWKLPYDEALLAAAIVRHVDGPGKLMNWAVDPPAGVTDEAIRRLGFAIGEFGGMADVEALGRRLGTSSGSELPVLQGALLGALAARTR